MTKTLQSLTEALLNAAKKAGAEAADALAVDGTSVSIDIRAGKLEQAERSEGVELGLRVLIGQRQACVSVSDTSDATIAVWPNAPLRWRVRHPMIPGGPSRSVATGAGLGYGGAGAVRRQRRGQRGRCWNPMPAGPRPPRWP